MASPRIVSPLLLALACGPGAPADSADTDTTTSPATTTGTTTPDPGTTPAQPTTSSATNTTSDTTGPPPPPIRGEWTGHYTSAFGFLLFRPCGTDEEWWVNGLPGPLTCQQWPLRLRVQGELSFTSPNAPELFVETIVEGPCSAETCDEVPPLGACNSFDALCLNEPQECDLFVELCPDGQKCTFQGSEVLRCVPIADDGLPPGSPCTAADDGSDDCDAQSVCWGGDGDAKIGTCHAYCLGTQDAAQCADPDSVCGEFAPDLFRLCIPRCDPLVQDCPTGQLCTVEQSFFRCVPDQSNNTGIPGTPCDAPGQCNPGLVCANAAIVPCEPVNAGCCTEFCDLDMPPICALPGQTCIPWFSEGDEVPPVLADLGVCALPL